MFTVVHWVVWEVLGVEAMLALIIGFDPKSSTAISKCRTEELYAILLVMQPMLMLGINIGVAFNVMFANRMVTVLLISFSS
ncbi:unnamed protein product [Prunus armeniaca]